MAEENRVEIADFVDEPQLHNRPTTPPNITVDATATSTPYHGWSEYDPSPDTSSKSPDEDEGHEDNGNDEVLSEELSVEQPFISESDEEDPESSAIELDSILPVAETLKNAFRVVASKKADDISYYLDGSPTAEDMVNFAAYVKRVDEFTLTTSSFSGFSFGALLRLSMMRNWQGSFFRSLKVLRVIECDNFTMQALSLFVSPTLETLEVTLGDKWDSDCYKSLESFIISLSNDAPKLKCLLLGTEGSPSHVYSPITASCRSFECLSTVHLEDVVVQDWPVLEGLGALDSLEELHLSVVCRRSYHGRSPTNSDGGKWDILADCVSDEDKNSFGFPQLRMLCITARLEILRDLLGYIASTELSELSVTLQTSSCDTPSLPDLKKMYSMQDATDEKVIAMVKGNRSRMRFTFRNEDEFFCHLLNRATKKWTSLASVIIDHMQAPTAGAPLRVHSFSKDAMTGLLDLQELTHLEIDSWSMDFDIDEVLSTLSTNPKSKLEIFHLPTSESFYEYSAGISWTTLADINEHMPNLMSFSGYFNRYIDDIPDYADGIPDTLSPNTTLRTLALGDGTLTWDSDIDEHYLLRVAFYLYSLFPKLRIIEGDEHEDDDDSSHDWDYIRRVLKICQASAQIGCQR